MNNFEFYGNLLREMKVFTTIIDKYYVETEFSNVLFTVYIETEYNNCISNIWEDKFNTLDKGKILLKYILKQEKNMDFKVTLLKLSRALCELVMNLPKNTEYNYNRSYRKLLKEFIDNLEN